MLKRILNVSFGLILIIFANSGPNRAAGTQSKQESEINSASKKDSIEPKMAYENWIGITPGISGNRIIVLSIYPGGSAQKAGLKESDYLVSINGAKIRSYEDFQFNVGKYKPGTVVDVTYDRASEIKTVQLTIARRPNLKDLVHTLLPKLNLEKEADKKTYIVPMNDGRIRLLYFAADLYNPKVHVQFLKIKRVLESQLKDVTIYGVGNQACEDIKFIPSGLLNPKDELVCKEKEIPKEIKQMFDVYFDAQGKSEEQYFLRIWPALILVDRNSMVRYADVLTELSVEEIQKIIDQLK
jgi:hypothetical protein